MELETDRTEISQPTELVRGNCLFFMLISMLITSPLVAIVYFISITTTVGPPLSNMPAWIIFLLGIGSIAQFIFAMAIWKWKKWGMYGLVGLSIIVCFINSIYINNQSAILGLAGAATIAFLLRKSWNQMG